MGRAGGSHPARPQRHCCAQKTHPRRPSFPPPPAPPAPGGRGCRTSPEHEDRLGATALELAWARAGKPALLRRQRTWPSRTRVPESWTRPAQGLRGPSSLSLVETPPMLGAPTEGAALCWALCLRRRERWGAAVEMLGDWCGRSGQACPLPLEAGHSPRQARRAGELRSLGSPYTGQARPQAAPPCRLGSPARGLPRAAEAVERDVPLAGGAVGHPVLRQTVPPGYTARPGGAGERGGEAACMNVGRTGLALSALPWSPGTSGLPASRRFSASPLPTWPLSCGLAADCSWRRFAPVLREGWWEGCPPSPTYRPEAVG